MKEWIKELFVGYYSNYLHICACAYFFVCKANKFKRLPTDSLLFSAGLSVFVWSPAGLWALSIQYRNKGQGVHKILQYVHIPVCTVCQAVCIKDNFFPFPLSLSLEHVLHSDIPPVLSKIDEFQNLKHRCLEYHRFTIVLFITDKTFQLLFFAVFYSQYLKPGYLNKSILSHNKMFHKITFQLESMQ